MSRHPSSGCGGLPLQRFTVQQAACFVDMGPLFSKDKVTPSAAATRIPLESFIYIRPRLPRSCHEVVHAVLSL